MLATGERETRNDDTTGTVVNGALVGFFCFLVFRRSEPTVGAFKDGDDFACMQCARVSPP